MADPKQHYSTVVPYVKTIVPQFLNQTDSNVVAFLEAYYEWLEQRGNVREYIDRLDHRDLDESISEFYEYFRQEFLKFVPENIAADKTTAIRVARELYRSKGSPASIRLLFRLLFDEDVDVFLPSEQIFKSSTARWNRDVSVRFRLTSGILTRFDDFVCTIRTSQRTYSFTVQKIERVPGTADIFEAFIVVDFDLQIPTGGTIETDDFVGQLVRTTTRKQILDPGVGFTIGDLYEVNNSGGTSTRIRITATTENGGIRSFDIVQFGSGFSSSFLHRVFPQFDQIAADENNLVIEQFDAIDQLIQSYEYFSPDSINRFNDTIILSSFDYTESPYDFFEDNTYVGQLRNKSESLTVVSDETINVEGFANVLFELGFVLRYPGYYSSNVGFTSNASYLQDGNYYQQYSYVIQSINQLIQYESIVSDNVHPAGYKFFGDYRIIEKFDILVSLITTLSSIESTLLDIIRSTDSQAKHCVKYLADISNTVDFVQKTYFKSLGDFYNVSDDEIKAVDKNIQDISYAIDQAIFAFSKTLSDITVITDDIDILYLKNSVDVSVAVDTLEKLVSNILNDVSRIGDVPSKSSAKILQDVARISEIIDVIFAKVFNDNIRGVDSIDDKHVDKSSVDAISLSSYGCALVGDTYYDAGTQVISYWDCGYAENEFVIDQP